MKLSQQSLSSIESAIQKVISKYTCNCEYTSVTDIYLQPDQMTGQLSFFNDDDEDLGYVIIKEWATYENNDFIESIQPVLRSILRKKKDAGSFDKMTILKPYSFVLVDDYKETITDLLLVDDDTLLVDDELLLKGLDQELDDFLKDLLEQ